MRRGRWRRRQGFAKPLRRRQSPRQEPDRRRLDVALAAGDLPGEAQPRHGPEPQRRVEELRRIEERVAMQPAKPRELGLNEARDRAEYARLLAMLELGLETDHVEQGAEPVVLAKLHD